MGDSHPFITIFRTVQTCQVQHKKAIDINRLLIFIVLFDRMESCGFPFKIKGAILNLTEMRKTGFRPA